MVSLGIRKVRYSSGCMGLCWALPPLPLRCVSAPQEYWRAAREHIFPSSSAITLLQRLVFFDRDRVPDKTIELLRGLVETEAFQKEVLDFNPPVCNPFEYADDVQQLGGEQSLGPLAESCGRLSPLQRRSRRGRLLRGL